MTSFPWTSSQARTQRSQRMHAWWLTAMTGFEVSSGRPSPPQGSAELSCAPTPKPSAPSIESVTVLTAGATVMARLSRIETLSCQACVHEIELGERLLVRHAVLAEAAGRVVAVDQRAQPLGGERGGAAARELQVLG